MIAAHSPQAKGRIERWFQVAQDRLVPELRMRQIKSMAEANKYLQEEFLKGYWNRRHTVRPKRYMSKYRSMPPGVDINEIFTMRYQRKINNDHTFRWKQNSYQILNPNANISGQQVELRFYRSGESRVFFAGRQLEVQLINPDIKQRAS